jgi:aminopeptidase-like protein
MRGRPGDWKEYHSSADDLDFVAPAALGDSLAALKDCVAILEGNKTWRATVLGEPQLGKRGLYPTITKTESLERTVQDMMDVLSYADGTRDLLGIAEHVGRPFSALLPHAERLAKEGLLAAA